MQSLVSFVAPTAYAQVTKHSLTAATPPYGLHTKINLHSKAFLVTCFTTESSQRSFFFHVKNLSSHLTHQFHSFFCLSLFFTNARDFFLGMRLPRRCHMWLSLWFWSPFLAYLSLYLTWAVSLKSEPIVSKIKFHFRENISAVGIDQWAKKVVLLWKKWAYSSVCSLVERVFMKLISILFVHIYLHSSSIRNIIHAQKK